MTDKNSIQVLERAFLLLEEIAGSPNVPHKVSHLAGKTGLKVPTVSKIVVHVSIESKNSLDLNTVRNNVKMVRF